MDSRKQYMGFQYKSVIGNSTSSIISPEFDLNMPFASYKIDYESSGNLTSFVSIDRGSWIEVNSSWDRHDLSSSASVIQVKYQSSEDNWSSEHKQVAIVSNRTDIVSMDGFRQ